MAGMRLPAQEEQVQEVAKQSGNLQYNFLEMMELQVTITEPEKDVAQRNAKASKGDRMEQETVTSRLP